MNGGTEMNPTRYRALCVGLVLLALCSAGGAVVVAQSVGSTPFEWIIFVIAAVVALTLFGMALPAHARGDVDRLELIARCAVALGAVLVVQRVTWELYGPLIDDKSRNLFRVSLAFMPFIYLAAITVLATRDALRLSWALLGAVILLALPALWIHTHFDIHRYGFTTVVVWLLLANPMFILMLHAQPQYEQQLARSFAELDQMRGRSEVADQLAQSDRRFNLVVQSLEVGVWEAWVGPPEGRWWSPRFYELLGYTAAELPMTEESFKALMHPDDRDAMWKKGRSQLAAREIMDVDVRIKTHHRGYRWFNSRAKASYGPDGRIDRIAGAIMDIHDQRLANDALRIAQSELTRLAYRDTLTDQYNRRYFEEHFQREWDRAHRTREPLSLLIVDIDHFKAYNDHYGHPVGDRCLVQVAQVLASAASRSADIVARLGGEEFGIVLPGTSSVGAEEVAQRIRDALKLAAIPHLAAPNKVVTVSIGISSVVERNGPSPTDLFEQADKALYEVKRRGRDGVFIYGSGAFTVTGEHVVEETGRHETIKPALKPEERPSD